MSDLLQLLPIYLFMLIPVWIPLATVALGAVSDALRAPGRVAGRHQADTHREAATAQAGSSAAVTA